MQYDDCQNILKNKKRRNNRLCNIIYHSTPNRGLNILVTVVSKLIPLFSNKGIRVHLNVYSSFSIYDRDDLDSHFSSLFDMIRNHPNMTLHKPVSNSEIIEILPKNDIFAYPSIFTETSCLCLIEAMAAGLVCVHSSLGALPETANGHTMMYEYTNDMMEHCTRFANTLINAISRLSSIRTKKQVKYTNQHFSLSRFTSQWKTLLDTVSSS